MQKNISFKQTVYEIVTEYPEMIDILKELGFEQITKPGMINIAGRVMTIPNGCKMKGISLDKVKETLIKHGFTCAR